MVPLPTSTKTGKQVDWVSQILRSWPSGFGERAALSALDAFIVEGMRCYEKDRGFADGRAVSRLSPYLHFGQLSPRLMVTSCAAWSEIAHGECTIISAHLIQRVRSLTELIGGALSCWPCLTQLPSTWYRTAP